MDLSYKYDQTYKKELFKNNEAYMQFYATLEIFHEKSYFKKQVLLETFLKEEDFCKQQYVKILKNEDILWQKM